MSTDLGAAPAAADSAPAPVVDEPIVDIPNPVETVDQPEHKVPEKPAGPPTIREALDKAEKVVQAKEAAKAEPAKVEAKEPAKAKADDKAPVKDPETGKFVAKDKPADQTKPASTAAAKPDAEPQPPAKSAYEAPKRFSEDAKKVWDSAPDPVKAEIGRMERELTQGIEKHREKAEKWDGLKELDDLATKSGTNIKDAFTRYVVMEQKIQADLLGGLDEVVSKATQGKYSLRDIAAHIMGQKPEDVQSQSDATIRELKQTVQRLEQQIGGVTTTINQQRETATLTEINKFAADHPRFEELADDIAFFMKTGRAKDLPDAYQLAERLNPAPEQAAKPEPAVAETKAPDLAEQIRKGSKSPTGAPPTGSDPASKKPPSKSIRESLDRAFAARG
jgi:hypothetical protein